jgi:hypothetical protein
VVKKFYIIAGGTMVYIAPHFSLCAPAYGTIGKQILAGVDPGPDTQVIRLFTTMADQNLLSPAREVLSKAGVDRLETNEDLTKVIRYLVSQKDTRCIVMAAAVCDFEPEALSGKRDTFFGKDSPRLSSKEKYTLMLRPAEKILSMIRMIRKDIFLAAFKTTAGLTPEETYEHGLKLLKRSSANLVFANDIRSHHNVVITPEEFPYHASSREEAVKTFSEMIAARTKLHFVRTKVVDGLRIDPQFLANENAIPSNFLPVLRHLIAARAYKPFLGKTSGHFGCKVWGKEFKTITSCRKEDHNQVLRVGMAKILDVTDKYITAMGGRPSVGEHTQQAIYKTLGDKVHSIVHFHSPLRVSNVLPSAPQKHFECGSVECGNNTASSMKEIQPGIFCSYLEGHGPNIAFHKDVDSDKVVKFINDHFIVSDKTGGALNES